MPTNDGELGKAVSNVTPQPAPTGDSPGYETTDVNVSGVVVFLGGLMGFLIIFFVVCFGIGKLINNQLSDSDGPTDKWHAKSTLAGGGKREDLTSNAVMQQKELSQMTQSFPTPRLDIDDGNQATADLHAREDLLLNHYSSNNGTVRIPIERAMELIAGKLPVAQGAVATTLMAGDAQPEPKAPLTVGFARTGYELDAMEARKQKMSFAKAEEGSHAELRPLK
jgi:hypothetical protein